MTVLRHPSQWLMLADNPYVAPVEPEKGALNLDDLTAAEIKEYFDKGELTAEEIYESELKAEKPRKGVLHAYAPKEEAPEVEAKDDDNDEGTGAEDA